MRKHFWLLGGFALLLLAVGAGAFFGMQDPAPRSVLGAAEIVIPTLSPAALEKPLWVVVDRAGSNESLRVVQEFTEDPTTLLTVDTADIEIDAIAISRNHENIFYAEYASAEQLTRLWKITLQSGTRELIGFTSRNRVTQLIAENKRLLYSEGDRGDTWYALELDDQQITRLVDHARNFISRDDGRAFAWLDVAKSASVANSDARENITDDVAPVADPLYVGAFTLSSTRLKSHGLGISAVALTALNDSELLLLEQTSSTSGPATGRTSYALNAVTDRGESKHPIATLTLANSESKVARLWADPITQQIIVMLPERWIVIDGDEQQEMEMHAEALGMSSPDEVLAWDEKTNRIMSVSLRTAGITPFREGALGDIQHVVWRE